MKRSCETLETYFKPNGNMAHRKTYSYVILLCKKGGDEVKAIRVDGYTSKYDMLDDVSGNYPDWNLKGIWKLYDSDFEEGNT